MPRGKGLYDDEKIVETGDADDDKTTDQDNTPDVDERSEEPTA